MDIFPAVLNELEISYDDLSFFKELGADGIRLDEGFDGNKEALLSYNPYNLAIELNMSNDGLPSLEMHRDLSIEVQAKHLFATNLIDTVIIGNAYASCDELNEVANIDPYCFDYLEKASPLEKEICQDNMHMRRGDITDLTARSTQVRVKYHDRKNQPHDNDHEFSRGDVVIGNDDFGKYKYELQILLKQHKDSRKNLVGKIRPEELPLLEFLTPWKKFWLSDNQ